jgi:hypothetical protein
MIDARKEVPTAKNTQPDQQHIMATRQYPHSLKLLILNDEAQRLTSKKNEIPGQGCGEK